MSLSLQQINTYLQDELFANRQDNNFVDCIYTTPADLVRYTMALASENLNDLTHSYPTSKHPIVINETYVGQIDARKYLWTAYMIFGSRSNRKFGNESLLIRDNNVFLILKMNLEDFGHYFLKTRFTKPCLNII
ncbi:MAG: hypothetical protein H0T84_13220 [Tatlockia sp.]|nr:hypothetical protein [Tatlockia sp.]